MILSGRTKRPTRSRVQRASGNPTSLTLASHPETDSVAELDVDDRDRETGEMDIDYVDEELHESETYHSYTFIVHLI